MYVSRLLIVIFGTCILELSESLPGPSPSKRLKKTIANLYNVTDVSLKLSKSSTSLGGTNSTKMAVDLGQMFEEASLTLVKVFQARGKIIYKDCCQPMLFQKNSSSGIYSLQGPLKEMAYCDMDDDGGGWIVLMRRSKPILAS